VLAHLSGADLDAVIARGLRSYSASTPVDAVRLRTELARVQPAGLVERHQRALHGRLGQAEELRQLPDGDRLTLGDRLQNAQRSGARPRLPEGPGPFYNGTAWFLPFGGAYYKAKDKLR
jgi:hypothetical protein